MRIRFTSPHPKDVPTEMLRLMRQRPNICKQLHLPVQSGSSAVLQRMRRGYTREAYLRLIEEVRELLPSATISTDVISGFCGETEAEHEETLSLMEGVGYDQAFLFHYSQREKTHAHRAMQDDVPKEVKLRRLQEVIDTFHRCIRERNQQLIGGVQLVLVEGPHRRFENHLGGRTDGNRQVAFLQCRFLGTQRRRRLWEVNGECLRWESTWQWRSCGLPRPASWAEGWDGRLSRTSTSGFTAMPQMSEFSIRSQQQPPQQMDTTRQTTPVLCSHYRHGVHLSSLMPCRALSLTHRLHPLP